MHLSNLFLCSRGIPGITLDLPSQKLSINSQNGSALGRVRAHRQ